MISSRLSRVAGVSLLTAALFTGIAETALTEEAEEQPATETQKTESSAELLATPEQRDSHFLGTDTGASLGPIGALIDIESLSKGLNESLAGTEPSAEAAKAVQAFQMTMQSRGEQKSEDGKTEGYGLGWLLGQSFLQRQVNIDPVAFIQGFKRGSSRDFHPEIKTFAEEFQVRAEAAEKKVSEAQRKLGEAYIAKMAKEEGIKKTAGGVLYRVIKKGDGPKPSAEDQVRVNYKGTLLDGEEFDSSYKRGQPAEFPLNKVIAGWTELLQEMNEGSKVECCIPADLAYGDRGTPSIAPGSTLLFEIELLKVINLEAPKDAEKRYMQEHGKKEGVITTESGLQYEVLKEGDGKEHPTVESKVKMHYKGTLLDGTEFDSSYSRNEPLDYPLNNLIPGWQEGVPHMTRGAKYRFTIPYALAYGERGAPPTIAPCSTLIFEVELLDFQ